MNFASPVAIQANTVYVASYFAPNGHYSGNLDYFATQGVDTPPLHALMTGVSGANGVFAYGATSTFPANSYRSLNYWVDVVFSPQPPPTLTSIAVTPANPTVTAGGTQQFTATATYSDSSTLDVTNQVTFASSATAVATVTLGGLATAISTGHDDDLGNPRVGQREHRAHRRGRPVDHHHDVASRGDRWSRLLGDAGGQRRKPAVHVGDRDRDAARRG